MTTTSTATQAKPAGAEPASLSAEMDSFYAAVKKGLPRGVALKGNTITLWGGSTCSPLRVKAFVLGDQRTDWTSIVEFPDPDGLLVECELPWRILQGKPRDAIAILADLGFRMSTDKIAGHVLDLIRSWPVPEDARQVGLQNFGWTKDRDAFAFPDGSVLSRGNGATFYRVPGEISARAIGTLEAWREGVGALSKGNPYLLFAVSAAFAAPLMSFTTLNTPIFHFHGKTSRGKSRVLMTALSTLPSTGKQLKTWTGTDNGIEGEIAKSHGLLAALDELPLEANPEFWSMIYRLSNGTAKARAGKDGAAKVRATWQTVILSAGEYSSRTVLEQLGKKMTGGQAVRIIDIPVSARIGAFETLHDHMDSESFTVALDDAISKASGPAGIAFVRGLFKNSDTDIQKYVNTQLKIEKQSLLDALGLSDQTAVPGEVHRVLNAFALVAVAGEIATKFGVTGWQPKTASEAVQSIARRWLEQRGMTADVDREVIDKTRAAIKHAQGRFAQIGEQGDDLPGYRDDEYFYLSSVLFAEIHGSTRQNKAAAAEQLEQAGFLHRGGERNSYMFKMPASVPSRPRMYRISREILAPTPETAQPPAPTIERNRPIDTAV